MRDDTRHCRRSRRVDTDDPRVRVRRAQKQHVGLPLGVVVVDKLARPREEARVLDAGDGFAAAKAAVLR